MWRCSQDDCDEYHSSFSVLEDSRYQKLSDKLSIHIFELPNVPKKIDPSDKKQLWMHLIKANSEEALEMLRATTSDLMIHKAIDAVYALNADAELREKIRQRDKAVRDYQNRNNSLAVIRREMERGRNPKIRY